MSSPMPMVSMFLLFLITCFPPTALSQNLGTTSPSGPTIVQCGPRLLPLTSCAPFVQGRAPLPVQQCCDNLKQLYIRQPDCLCLLLNGTTLTSLPINTTLALQLPLICSLQAGLSSCSGLPVPFPSTSPTPQVSSGPNNSTVAASPMVTLTPRPNIMGFRYFPSAGKKLKPESTLLVVVLMVLGAATVSVFTSILC